MLISAGCGAMTLPPPSQVDVLFAKLDTNANGELSFSEVNTWVRRTRCPFSAHEAFGVFRGLLPQTNRFREQVRSGENMLPSLKGQRAMQICKLMNTNGDRCALRSPWRVCH